MMTVDTIGSTFDTSVGVYTGDSVASLTPVASDDDYALSVASHVTFDAITGQTYQIAVDGYNGASGSIVLNLQQTSSGSTAVPTATVSGDATFAQAVLQSSRLLLLALLPGIWFGPTASRRAM